MLQEKSLIWITALSLSVFVACGDDDGDGGSDADAAAAQDVVQTEPWLDINDLSEPGGGATLTRFADGHVEATMMDPLTMEADVVYTLWWIFWNKPENCVSFPNDDGEFLCGPDDLTDEQIAATELSVGYAGPFPGGSVITDSTGVVTFEDRSIGLNEDDDTFILPGGLSDQFTSEIHLLVQAHGAPLEGEELMAQQTQFLAGCPPNPDGDCVDVIFAAFPPVEEACEGHGCL